MACSCVVLSCAAASRRARRRATRQQAPVASRNAAKRPPGCARCIPTTRWTRRQVSALRHGAGPRRAVRRARLPARLPTIPPVVKAGQKATLRFRSSIPAPASRSRSSKSVHERQYHLFVISQDMEYFQHIHPERAARRHVDDRRDAAEGGLLQGAVGLSPERRRVAVHRAAAGDGGLRRRSCRRQRASRAGHGARRRPSTTSPRRVSLDPPTFVAGLYGHLNFHLTDTATGRPITDLQTYLGAFGHTLIMSEDMVDYVHSHPLDILAHAGRRRRAAAIPDSAGRRSGEAARRSGRDLRRPDAEARPLSRLDAVPAQRQALHVRVHVQRGRGDRESGR